jgi:hypothetical protein
MGGIELSGEEQCSWPMAGRQRFGSQDPLGISELVYYRSYKTFVLYWCFGE